MANQQEVSSGRAGNGERAGTLSDKTHEAAEQMKSAVGGQLDQARQHAESVRDQAEQRIRRVAVQLRNASEALQPDDDLAGRLAQRASAGIDKVAAYVHSADLRRLRSDAESLARARPAAFFGGAFLLGLALGRFFKSSGPSSNGRPRVVAQGSSPMLGDGSVSTASREQEWKGAP